MNKKRKVLVFSCKSENYAKAAAKSGFTAYTAATESDAFLNLKELEYDVLIMDAEFSMSFYSGEAVREAAKMKRGGKPYIIAVSDVNDIHHHAHIKGLGADSVVYREDAEKALPEMIAESLWRCTDKTESKRLHTEGKVLEDLQEQGFSNKNKGTDFLAQAITEVLYTPELTKQLSKAVYPVIAAKNGTTSAAVERNIRFAIGKISDMTNAEFIKSEVLRLKAQGLPQR